MATLLLAAAGSAIGAGVGGSVLGIATAVVGQAIGASIGGAIDQKLFGQGAPLMEQGRVDQFKIQSTAEGAAIPVSFGRTRLAGQMIWSSNFKETVETTETGGKGGGVSTKTYSYTVSIALGLGEAGVTKIGRIWADGQQVSKADLTLALYDGTGDQLPDPTISAVEGLDNTPAFRGLSYVVIENLDLAPFGNRIPQFNFEVFRSVQGRETLRDAVQGVCLIPGSGEFSLSTEPVHFEDEFANNKSANVNTSRGQADFVHGIEDLVDDLPNCGSVSLVVSWFGDDLRCGTCTIRPKVDQKLSIATPQSWSVAGLNRTTADQIGLSGDAVAFGGTPSDRSVIDAIKHLKISGQDVVFYPFILMDIQAGNAQLDPWSGASDQPVMPWRGRITTSVAPNRTGSPDQSSDAKTQVDHFFGTAQASDFQIDADGVNYSGPQDWSYSRFILHNAALCVAAGGVSAFCIGSEMRGLTQIRGAQNTFPAVAHLKALATEVRALLGANTKIGYAADWSEYFGYHPQDGSGDLFYHLDPLWADPEIDFVGIDNYMPLSDWRAAADHLDAAFGSVYNLDYLMANVEGGEGYDWYYGTQLDRDTQTRRAITDGAHDEPWVYRYKDIRNWWARHHYQRIGGVKSGVATDWIPQSKPVFFTEFGCPSIHLGTNQPNVFVDPKSSESNVPHGSDGSVDELIQARYLTAITQYWSDATNNPVSEVYAGPMIDLSHAHVWAWDARPWPEFPARSDIWSDASNYATGHWMSGRAFLQELADVVREICAASGVMDIDVSDLNGLVIGYAIERTQTGRASLQPLMQAYDFTCVEIDGVLVFAHAHAHPDQVVQVGDMGLDVEGQDQYTRTRTPVSTRLGQIQLTHYDADNDYQSASLSMVAEDVTNATFSSLDLPLALRTRHARSVGAKLLAAANASVETINFALPPSHLALTSGDVVAVDDSENATLYRVDTIEEQGARLVTGTRIEPPGIVDLGAEDQVLISDQNSAPLPVSAMFMDLPNLTSRADDHQPYAAATAHPWSQVSIYGSPEEDGFEAYLDLEHRAVFGKLLSPLKRAQAGRWSRADMHVKPSQAALQSKSRTAVLNGANALAIKDAQAADWEVIQFEQAVLQPDGSYILRNLLRGQLGTDAVMPDQWPAGAAIVFLDRHVAQLPVPSTLIDTPMTYLSGPRKLPYTHSAFKSQTFTARAVGQRPYSVSHLKHAMAGTGLTISWVRRTRIDGDGWLGTSVPLGEAEELYEIRVEVGGQVLRTVLSDTPTWTYSQAQRTADGIASSFDVTVAQISQTYGAGPATRITINV